MQLILNTSFPSLNEYINVERTNRYKAAKFKEEYTNKVAHIAQHYKFKLEDKKYDVIFNWYTPDNRMDHDNIAFNKKFILDGLVVAGALINDTPKYINNFEDNFFIDKSRNFVSCIVVFVEIIN
jgi:hypothetical protein